MAVSDAGTRKARIHVGTAGWSYPDWLGIVYPHEAGRKLNELSYLAQFFDSVEINNTFYRPPSPAYCEKWLADVSANPDFSFTLKLWQRFTHGTEEPWQQSDAEAFRNGIAPLADARRLGAVLVQFPWSFQQTRENTDRLARIADAFSDLPLVVEVRHVSWQSDEFTDFLSGRGVGFCNIDQPLSRSGIGRTNIATGPVAYYRFHGRNREKWFLKGAGRDERYDYLYSAGELTPWIKNIVEMSARVERIFVMANNHYRGQAPANALQIKAALSGEKVRVPPLLLKQYPFLSEVAR